MADPPDPLAAVTPIVWGIVGGIVAGSVALVAVLGIHRRWWGRR